MNKNKYIIARVIEIKSSVIVVSGISTHQIYNCVIKGNIKSKSNILVGDIVYVEAQYDKYVIYKIEERKNFFIRPPVANIDNLIICLSLSNPKPDYLLLDKELIFCYKKNIKPIICLNKIDNLNDNKKSNKDVEYIKNVYKNLGIDVVFTSAKENIGIDELEKLLFGKISAFSGNSGVGKSSIISILTNDLSVEVGDISKKNKKGKNTTKYIKLYSLKDDTYILDTPGFSSYELIDVDYKELKNYYAEFFKYKCKYDDCNHVNEDECEVKNAIKNNKIDSLRYDRYKYLYNELLEKDKRKYK